MFYLFSRHLTLDIFAFRSLTLPAALHSLCTAARGGRGRAPTDRGRTDRRALALLRRLLDGSRARARLSRGIAYITHHTHRYHMHHADTTHTSRMFTHLYTHNTQCARFTVVSMNTYLFSFISRFVSEDKFLGHLFEFELSS
jgi:hypothetical protein